jgi:hypothetical protein
MTAPATLITTTTTIQDLEVVLNQSAGPVAIAIPVSRMEYHRGINGLVFTVIYGWKNVDTGFVPYEDMPPAKIDISGEEGDEIPISIGEEGDERCDDVRDVLENNDYAVKLCIYVNTTPVTYQRDTAACEMCGPGCTHLYFDAGADEEYGETHKKLLHDGWKLSRDEDGDTITQHGLLQYSRVPFEEMYITATPSDYVITDRQDFCAKVIAQIRTGVGDFTVIKISTPIIDAALAAPAV